MKTHFATVERGNESNPSDEWSEPLCNTETSNDIDVSNTWASVSCKKCLNLRGKFEQETNQEMEYSCNDMAEYLKVHNI